MFWFDRRLRAYVFLLGLAAGLLSVREKVPGGYNYLAFPLGQFHSRHQKLCSPFCLRLLPC